MNDSLLVLLGAMVYFITTAWVFGGLPPLYRHAHFRHGLARSTMTAEQRAILKKMRPSYAIFVVAMICFLMSSPLGSSLPTYIGAACLIASGLRPRTILRNETGLPTPWLSCIARRWPASGRVLSRFPMLPYDIWTVGWTVTLMTLAYPLV